MRGIEGRSWVKCLAGALFFFALNFQPILAQTQDLQLIYNEEPVSPSQGETLETINGLKNDFEKVQGLLNQYTLWLDQIFTERYHENREDFLAAVEQGELDQDYKTPVVRFSAKRVGQQVVIKSNLREHPELGSVLHENVPLLVNEGMPIDDDHRTLYTSRLLMDTAKPVTWIRYNEDGHMSQLQHEEAARDILSNRFWRHWVPGTLQKWKYKDWAFSGFLATPITALLIIGTYGVVQQFHPDRTIPWISIAAATAYTFVLAGSSESLEAWLKRSMSRLSPEEQLDAKKVRSAKRAETLKRMAIYALLVVPVTVFDKGAGGLLAFNFIYTFLINGPLDRRMSVELNELNRILAERRLHQWTIPSPFRKTVSRLLNNPSIKESEISARQIVREGKAKFRDPIKFIGLAVYPYGPYLTSLLYMAGIGIAKVYNHARMHLLVRSYPQLAKENARFTAERERLFRWFTSRHDGAQRAATACPAVLRELNSDSHGIIRPLF